MPQETIGIKEQYTRFIGRKILFISLFLTLLILIAAVSSLLGSADIPAPDVYAAILNKFFPAQFIPSPTETIEVGGIMAIVWNSRLPRILMGVAAGIGLAVAGATMQGILRNPLASPYTLGIASAAGFGAALGILLDVGIAGGRYLVITNAFIFALIASAVIIGVARHRGTRPETMILAGIAIAYFFSAMTSLLQYFGDADAVKEVVFWMLGDLDRASWNDLTIAVLVLVCCIPLLILKSWDFNVMGAGDETAKSLGVNVERVRMVTMALASLVTAGVVCFTGSIMFVGLVAPHITRMIIGGDNRFLLPASGLVGAVLLVGADAISRSIIPPVILPVGVMTSFIGVPFFFYLIVRKRREYW